MDKVFEQYLALEEKVKGYNPNLNIERLRAAYELSRNAHGDQKEKMAPLRNPSHSRCGDYRRYGA